MIGQHNVTLYATEKTFEIKDQASSPAALACRAKMNWNVSFGDQKLIKCDYDAMMTTNRLQMMSCICIVSILHLYFCTYPA